jgi:hypothetical protein
MQPAIERTISGPNRAKWSYLMTLVWQIWGQRSNKWSGINGRGGDRDSNRRWDRAREDPGMMYFKTRRNYGKIRHDGHRAAS